MLKSLLMAVARHWPAWGRRRSTSAEHGTDAAGAPHEQAAVDVAVRALKDLLSAAVAEILAGRVDAGVQAQTPVALSRAEGADYLALVRLWNAGGGDPIASLAPRGCPACAGIDHRHLFTSYDRYPFHVCNDCGTWFVPYAVTDAFIEEFFENVPAARIIADRMMAGRDGSIRDSDRARFLQYFDLVASVLPGAESGRRYLDIGCGVGHSVELAYQRGMSAIGLEINQVALEKARLHGRPVLHPAAWQAAGSFDLISMFETLEHITDPDQVMAMAAQRLAPGGVLMVTVPNRASWEVSVLQQRCFHVFGGCEGVGHVNLFDIHGVSRLFARHDLTVLHVDGQFGNSLFELCHGLLKPDAVPLDRFGQGVTSFVLPSDVHHLLNSIGPYVSQLDRVTGRSPILLAMACRTADRQGLTAGVDALRARRRTEILAALG